jgi:uncharacterized protein (UPF0335 family)
MDTRFRDAPEDRVVLISKTVNWRDPTTPVRLPPSKPSRAAVAGKPAKPGAVVAQAEAFTPREMGIAADQLRSIIERIERLEEEKASLADDVKGVYGEAKGAGFDTKIIRRIVAMRKKDADERREEEAVTQLYLEALGMA